MLNKCFDATLFFAERIRLHLNNLEMCQRHTIEHKEQIRILLIGKQDDLVLKFSFFFLS